jgi:RNA polymerase sigma-70 factor (ECF subfamily)
VIRFGGQRSLMGSPSCPMSPSPVLKLVPPPRPVPSGTRSALSEGELVRGLKEGDQDAADQLYRRYARDVWRMLHRILGDDQELDDLHHEVFFQAIRAAPRFRGQSALKSWLIGIAISCAREKLRSRRRRRWLSFMAPDELPEITAEPSAGHEPARAAFELIGKLPPEERIAFTLRFVEGMTLDEAALAMGISTGTLKRRLRKARARFLEQAANHPELCHLREGDER